MINLPESMDNDIDVNLLEGIFDIMFNSYKIYWFNSIIDEIMIGNTTILFKNIAIGMIAENWNIILKYNLNLGETDKLKEVIIEINKIYIKDKKVNKNQIYNELISLEDSYFEKLISKFYEYVPYRLLTPFFQDQLKGIKNDRERNRKMEEITTDNPKAIYEINSKGKYIHIHENWIKYIYDNEVVLKQWIMEKKKNFLESKNEDKLELIDKIFKKYDYDMEKKKSDEELIEIVDDVDVSEALGKINDYIRSQGFTYPSSLIKNLYLSLKSKPFVILSGISGTGKSKLVQLFAEALGSTYNDKMFNLVPVKPEWSDSSELLGFRNIEGHFVPGIITKIAKEAMMNPHIPYFVCLDEMNLARVEYYFSDILSVMESRKFNDDHEIVSSYLLNDMVFGDDNEARALYGGVYFPGNLYIAGTVNMDETTFPFSKKVLDRASVIEFNTVDLHYSFDDLLDYDDEYIYEKKIYHNDFLKSDFIKIAQCREYKDTAVKVIDQLVNINSILEKYNSHFGYRVRDEIVFYVVYAVKYKLMSFEEAMDLCVLQKILPKAGGSSRETLEMLFDLFEFFTEYKIENRQYLEDNDIDNMLSAINDNVTAADDQDYEFIKYEFTCKKLLYMIRRYNNDSFTTFYM